MPDATAVSSMPSGAKYSTSISERRVSSSMISRRCSATGPTPHQTRNCPHSTTKPKGGLGHLTNIETPAVVPLAGPEVELSSARRGPRERRRVQSRGPIEPERAPCALEARVQPRRERPRAALPRVEVRVVDGAAVHLLE